MSKRIVLGVLSIILLYGSYICVGASDVASENKVYENVMRWEDEIIMKYRYYDGRLQYRRWNETKQCWVDPYWIDAV